MNIEIRKWTDNDLENLQKYANNKNISDNLADAFPSPYTNEAAVKFLERVSNDTPTKIFAITLDNQAVGSIGFFPDSDIHRKNAAIAYWIAEPFWGKGIAPKAIKSILQYGFINFDVVRIYAKPFGRNINSHKVLEKCGSTLEATLKNSIYKNGQFLDELIYSIRKESFEESNNR